MGSASRPNPALERLGFLVGKWRTTGKHPMVPGATLHGEVSFELIEGGAFIVMRSRMDDARFPAGIAIFGSDDGTGEYFMLYFDERGVSRKYDVGIDDHSWRWWRNAPELSQRFAVTVSADRRTMEGRGQLSRDGSTWEGDLDLTYTKTG